MDGEDGTGRLISKWESLIRDEREKMIDRRLFGLSQQEALSLSAPHRMLLSCAWEAIESAGWSMNDLNNSATGVFIGAQTPPSAAWRPPMGLDSFNAITVSTAMLANRISYQFNLMGPSASYCTACSAALTATHAAWAALKNGDCEQALIGSSNYLAAPRVSSAFGALGIISPDGKCYSFDAEANGYIRAEGAFIFLAKPLETALNDGDRICAVIEATAVNAAGSADESVGLAKGRYITAPTRHAQIMLMRAALTRAGIQPSDIDYVEAHATGTVVGDRIEGDAISEVFRGSRGNTPLRISSVKSNVGHLESASFHAGLLKTLLMLERRTFAPISQNFQIPNPEIDFDRCPMEVQTVCEPFPDRPVRIGINSFGFGGANGHCIVREFRAVRSSVWSVPASTATGYMVPLSAISTASLNDQARQLRKVLEAPDVPSMDVLVGNLCRRRTHFLTRTSFAAYDCPELAARLDAFIDNPQPISVIDEGDKHIAMVFSGQGTQWAGCGTALYDADPVFRRVVDAIDQEWLRRANFSIKEAWLSARRDEIDEVRLAQPVIFMVQCALLELYKTWGIYPDCVFGHSSGEVAAAYASGALSLQEATHLVYHRAMLQQRVAGSGRMLAIGLDRAGIIELLKELGIPHSPQGDGRKLHVEVACENSPASSVICGKEEALRPVIAELKRRNLPNRLLAGNIAFHSSTMDLLHEDVLESLAFLDDCTFECDVPFVSSVTGETTSRFDSAYWWSNIRQPVQFASAMETIRREYHPDVILEIAPHNALQPIVAQCYEGSTPPPFHFAHTNTGRRRMHGLPRVTGSPVSCWS